MFTAKTMQNSVKTIKMWQSYCWNQSNTNHSYQPPVSLV